MTVVHIPRNIYVPAIGDLHSLGRTCFVNRKVDHLIAEKLTFFTFQPNG
jgi:hypothetical protein